MEQTKLDIKEIAKMVRTFIKEEGGVFGVKINRQWEKIKAQPHSVLYISGCFPFMAGHERQHKDLQLEGFVNKLAEEQDLKVIKSLTGYTLVKFL